MKGASTIHQNYFGEWVHFNFQKYLNIMFKHCLGVFERPLKFHLLGGGHQLFTKRGNTHLSTNLWTSIKRLMAQNRNLTPPSSKLWTVPKCLYHTEMCLLADNWYHCIMIRGGPFKMMWVLMQSKLLISTRGLGLGYLSIH